MLSWKTTTDTRHRTTTFQATGGSNADAVGAALIDVWQKTLAELATRCYENSWDLLICQLITQCGIVVIFPASKTGEMQDAGFAVQFSVEEWSKAYENLPDPDDDDSKFTRAYDRLHKNQVRALKTGIGDPQVRTQFAALKRRPSFAVFCVDEGDGPIRDRMEFLWGNRPPKREFRTAKELFEHLFHKAEQTPDYSMRVRDGKVVAVNWFGHEFTDRYVGMLEEVPNLANICNDLKDFVLTASRVTPSGVERLKTLLPRVRFTVISDREFEAGTDISGNPFPFAPRIALNEMELQGLLRCAYCKGSGQCYCKRRGVDNLDQCVRCNGSGKCHICKGTGR